MRLVNIYARYIRGQGNIDRAKFGMKNSPMYPDLDPNCQQYDSRRLKISAIEFTNPTCGTILVLKLVTIILFLARS